MAKILNTYGQGMIERNFNFEKKQGYTETVTAKIQFNAELTGEQTQKLADALSRFTEELKKIVEEF